MRTGSVTTSRPNARIDARVVAEAFELRRIQRGISAPQASEKRASCEKFAIGMMPGTIGTSMPASGARVDEAEVRVGVVEVLRDRGIRAGVDLALEVVEVLAAALRDCGWYSGYAATSMWNQSPVSLADERDELVRVAELARVDASRRQVAAQRDEVPDAVRAIASSTSRMPSRVEPMHEMCGAPSWPSARISSTVVERAFARRAAGAERHRAERGLELRELARARRAASPCPPASAAERTRGCRARARRASPAITCARAAAPTAPTR